MGSYVQVKNWLKKVLIAVAVVEVTYLILVNAALNFPVTQMLVCPVPEA